MKIDKFFLCFGFIVFLMSTRVQSLSLGADYRTDGVAFCHLSVMITGKILLNWSRCDDLPTGRRK
jgi:hypothetical protein